MKNQRDWDQFYLKVAELTAQQSYAEDRKVGAIIVKDDNILSFSYNGTVRGTDNRTEDSNGKTLCTVLHAEAQAIAKVARSNSSTSGSTMYTTLSPCMECAKLISQVGIARLIYRDTYKDTAGIQFLKNNRVLVNTDYLHYRNQLADPEWLAQTGLLDA